VSVIKKREKVFKKYIKIGLKTYEKSILPIFHVLCSKIEGEKNEIWIIKEVF